MSVYVVDTNFFVQAHRSSYPLDVVTSFWNKVKELAHHEKIVSIDKVQAEIYKNEDELKKWCQTNLPSNFFRDSNHVMVAYGKVTQWALSRSDHFRPEAIEEFLDAQEADAFIIAFVLDNPDELTLVTQEISDPNSKRRIKIPDVCISHGIKYVNLMGMFRELGETF